KTSGRPATSRCESWPAPTRNINSPRAHARGSLKPAAAGVILETHVFLAIRQGDIAGRPIALLGDDHFRDALDLAPAVHARAMQHEDRVGVLLDRAALAQVGESGAMVLSILGRSIDLGERHDRDPQFAREELQPAGNVRDLLLPAIPLVF